MSRQDACPVCAFEGADTLLRRAASPVLQNATFRTAEEARAVQRGDLDFRHCHRCGFVWNAAFKAELVVYGLDYENSQTHSPAFLEHVEQRIARVMSLLPDGPATVVEVGCGQGDFLARLAQSAGPGRFKDLIGFDPAWRGEDGGGPAGARIYRRLYAQDDPIASAIEPDLVIARHTIEHVPDPVGFLQSIRGAMVNTKQAVLVLETPCNAWIRRTRTIQDFFFEHCSIFDMGSMARALDTAGFDATRIQTVFGQQYLWAEAIHRRATTLPPVDELPSVWRERVANAARKGPVAVWGAGAKGATFVQIVDPDATLVRALVDVNPRKQDFFIGGTGHPILSPEKAAELKIATVFVTNPLYTDEIAAMMERLGWVADRIVVDQDAVASNV